MTDRIFDRINRISARCFFKVQLKVNLLNVSRFILFEDFDETILSQK